MDQTPELQLLIQLVNHHEVLAEQLLSGAARGLYPQSVASAVIEAVDQLQQNLTTQIQKVS